MALHGPKRDMLMIVGNGVDAAGLTDTLRGNFRHASLEIVEEVEYQQLPQVEYYNEVSDPFSCPCTIL